MRQQSEPSQLPFLLEGMGRVKQSRATLLEVDRIQPLRQRWITAGLCQIAAEVVLPDEAFVFIQLGIGKHKRLQTGVVQAQQLHIAGNHPLSGIQQGFFHICQHGLTRNPQAYNQGRTRLPQYARLPCLQVGGLPLFWRPHRWQH